MMEVSNLTTLKKRKILMPENLVNDLEKYSQFLSENSGEKFQIDDVLASALINSKIKPSKIEKVAEVKVKLPEAAWSNLKALGMGNIEAGTKELCKHLNSVSSDKKFTEWKSNNTELS